MSPPQKTPPVEHKKVEDLDLDDLTLEQQADIEGQEEEESTEHSSQWSDEFDGMTSTELHRKTHYALQLLNKELDLTDMSILVGVAEEVNNAFLTQHKSAFVIDFLRRLKRAVLFSDDENPALINDPVTRVQILAMLDFHAFVDVFEQYTYSPAHAPFYLWVNQQKFIVTADPKSIKKELVKLVPVSH